MDQLEENFYFERVPTPTKSHATEREKIATKGLRRGVCVCVCVHVAHTCNWGDNQVDEA